MDPTLAQIGTVTFLVSGPLFFSWSLMEILLRVRRLSLLVPSIAQASDGFVCVKGVVTSTQKQEGPESEQLCSAWVCELVHFARKRWNIVTILHSVDPISLTDRTGVVTVDFTHVDCRNLKGEVIGIIDSEGLEHYRSLAGADKNLSLRLTEFRIQEGDELYVQGRLATENGQKTIYGTAFKPVLLEGTLPRAALSHLMGCLIGVTFILLSVWVNDIAPLPPLIRIACLVGGAGMGIFASFQPRRLAQ